MVEKFSGGFFFLEKISPIFLVLNLPFAVKRSNFKVGQINENGFEIRSKDLFLDQKSQDVVQCARPKIGSEIIFWKDFVVFESSKNLKLEFVSQNEIAGNMSTSGLIEVAFDDSISPENNFFDHDTPSSARYNLDGDTFMRPHDNANFDFFEENNETLFRQKIKIKLQKLLTSSSEKVLKQKENPVKPFDYKKSIVEQSLVIKTLFPVKTVHETAYISDVSKFSESIVSAFPVIILEKFFFSYSKIPLNLCLNQTSVTKKNLVENQEALINFKNQKTFSFLNDSQNLKSSDADFFQNENTFPVFSVQISNPLFNESFNFTEVQAKILLPVEKKKVSREINLLENSREDLIELLFLPVIKKFLNQNTIKKQFEKKEFSKNKLNKNEEKLRKNHTDSKVSSNLPNSCEINKKNVLQNEFLLLPGITQFSSKLVSSTAAQERVLGFNPRTTRNIPQKLMFGNRLQSRKNLVSSDPNILPNAIRGVDLNSRFVDLITAEPEKQKKFLKEYFSVFKKSPEVTTEEHLEDFKYEIEFLKKVCSNNLTLAQKQDVLTLFNEVNERFSKWLTRKMNLSPHAPELDTLQDDFWNDFLPVFIPKIIALEKQGVSVFGTFLRLRNLSLFKLECLKVIQMKRYMQNRLKEVRQEVTDLERRLESLISPKQPEIQPESAAHSSDVQPEIQPESAAHSSDVQGSKTQNSSNNNENAPFLRDAKKIEESEACDILVQKTEIEEKLASFKTECDLIKKEDFKLTEEEEEFWQSSSVEDHEEVKQMCDDLTTPALWENFKKAMKLASKKNYEAILAELMRLQKNGETLDEVFVYLKVTLPDGSVKCIRMYLFCEKCHGFAAFREDKTSESTNSSAISKLVKKVLKTIKGVKGSFSSLNIFNLELHHHLFATVYEVGSFLGTAIYTMENIATLIETYKTAEGVAINQKLPKAWQNVLKFETELTKLVDEFVSYYTKLDKKSFNHKTDKKILEDFTIRFASLLEKLIFALKKTDRNSKNKVVGEIQELALLQLVALVKGLQARKAVPGLLGRLLQNLRHLLRNQVVDINFKEFIIGSRKRRK